MDDNEIWRITHMEVRQRCASLKLASRVIGMATATTSSNLDDASILHDLQEVLQRLSSLREIGLTLVGADRRMSDFSIIFNVVTNIMLNVITEEWKWSRLEPNKTPLLSTDTIGKLLDSVIKIQPERFECTIKEGLDLAMTRRLCVLEAIPKLYSLTNIFDYYQKILKR